MAPDSQESGELAVAPSCEATAPISFLRANSPALSAQIVNNFVGALRSVNLYQNIDYLPVERLNAPTQYLTQKYGDVILTDTGKPGWYVMEPKTGFGSRNTAIIVTATTEAGSPTAKIVGNVDGDYRWLPSGMNVIIGGAGAQGLRVMANNGSELTLDTPAGATRNAANVTYQSPVKISEVVI